VRNEEEEDEEATRSIGGMTSAALTSPLDVLKTRLQSDFYRAQLLSSAAAASSSSSSSPLNTSRLFHYHRHHHPLSPLSFASKVLLHLRETVQILASIRRAEGWRALFKGLGPNLTGVVPARAINFYTYGNGKRLIGAYFNDGREAAWVHVCAAACAGVVTGTATNPIWLVKTRLQLDRSEAEKRSGGGGVGGAGAGGAGAGGAGAGGGRRYKNSIDCVRQVLRQEGIAGLYRGLSASYLGVTESTLQWVLYEQMKLRLARHEQRRVAAGRARSAWDRALDWGGKLGAAGSAKLFAAVATYPHEVSFSFLSLRPFPPPPLLPPSLCLSLHPPPSPLLSFPSGSIFLSPSKLHTPYLLY
jgi:solute carrier family 25 protein 33/36